MGHERSPREISHRKYFKNMSRKTKSESVEILLCLNRKKKGYRDMWVIY